MMYAVLVILLVFVLSVAGFLAYQNSKLVSNQRIFGSSLRDSSLTYSIFDESSVARIEDPDTVPLFQYVALVGSNGQVIVNKQTNMFILCRVASGKGELVLADAEHKMLNYIRLSSSSKACFEHKAFLHRTTNHAEKEMILNLEDAVKLQYT